MKLTPQQKKIIKLMLANHGAEISAPHNSDPPRILAFADAENVTTIDKINWPCLKRMKKAGIVKVRYRGFAGTAYVLTDEAIAAAME